MTDNDRKDANLPLFVVVFIFLLSLFATYGGRETNTNKIIDYE